MKSKFKGLLALLLAFVLVLTACGGDDDTSTSGESTDTSTETSESTGTETSETTEGDDSLEGTISVQVEEGWQDYYNAAAERVKANFPNVDFEFIVSGAFDHLDVLDQTDATNKDVADLFAIPADRLYGLSDNEVLAAIDSQKLAEAIGGWDNFDDGIGGNFKVDDSYLAFPYNIETLITFVNTANAEANGIDASQPLEIADIENGNTILLPLFDAWYGVAATNAAEIELLGQGEDGALFSDLSVPWEELDPAKQEAINTIYEYWKLHDEANDPLFDADAGWAFIDEVFTTGGEGVARLGGPWDTSIISEQAGEGNLEIYPISQLTLNGNPLTHWQGGWGLALNARIEEDPVKMQIAEELIKEIVNPEFAVDLFDATGKVLENVDTQVYADSDLSDTDKKVIEATITSYQEAPARPLFTEWGSVWDTWKNAILSWNSVKPATVEDAYTELQASFEAMMANFQ